MDVPLDMEPCKCPKAMHWRSPALKAVEMEDGWRKIWWGHQAGIPTSPLTPGLCQTHCATVYLWASNLNWGTGLENSHHSKQSWLYITSYIEAGAFGWEPQLWSIGYMDTLLRVYQQNLVFENRCSTVVHIQAQTERLCILYIGSWFLLYSVLI